jgi:hypothetical protein
MIYLNESTRSLKVRLDIIFLRAWYSIQPRRFYNPVTSLLLSGERKQWEGMHLTGQLRKEQGLAAPKNINSTYKVPIDHSWSQSRFDLALHSSSSGPLEGSMSSKFQKGYKPSSLMHQNPSLLNRLHEQPICKRGRWFSSPRRSALSSCYNKCVL